MKATRARRTIFVLVGFCLLASLTLLVLVAHGLGDADQPIYQGKTVGQWFMEYAYASNAPSTPPRNLSLRTLPDGRMELVQITSDGRFVKLLSTTNRAELFAWMRQRTLPPRDAAWDALQAIGSNAVPCLVRHFRAGVLERAYERSFTNLPPVIQKQLPNPSQRQWLRVRAIDTLARLKLGESGRAATPYLLELLERRDPSLRRAVVNALRSLHVAPRVTTRVLLRLGSQRKYDDVVEIAGRMGWDGDDMARLLGNILQSPDPALRKEAMSLLERSGTAATPVLDSIVLALNDPDWEVRYLAARCLEAMGTNSPQVVSALRTALEDESVMVQNVARRTLTNVAPNLVLPP